MEKLIIEIPKKSEVKFLIEVINRLGFKSETLEEKLKNFVKNTPKNVPISDLEIMNEIHAVRKNRTKNANS